MLSFQEFFDACSGLWKTERIYHYTLDGEIERSYTEFRAQPLILEDKQRILAPYQDPNAETDVKLDPTTLRDSGIGCPGFAIAFETRSETGEEVSMSLKALFLPDQYITTPLASVPPFPLVAQVIPDSEIIQGLYLRDEGYSEGGAIAGRFTYQPTRQTLEMTTYYRRSVAVDQMRFVAPDTRIRTIVTYKRPEAGEVPQVINLIGFGVERRQAA
jgi:hypothetical protein